MGGPEVVGGPEAFSAGYFREHARAPVRFMAGVRELAALGCTAFVEIGPAPVLCGMARPVAGQDVLCLPSLRKGRGDWDTLLGSLGTLYVNGADVDWAGLDRGSHRNRVVLPAYPFQRKRYWMKPVSGAAAGTSVLGRRISSPLAAVQYQATLTADAHPCLAECVFEGTAVVNAGFYIEAALEAAERSCGTRPDRVLIGGLTIPRALVMTGEGLVTSLVLEGETFRCFRRASGPGTDEWIQHARGSLRAGPDAGTDEPGATDIGAIARRCERELAGEEFYRQMAARGLEFGPSARWHERIARGNGEALSWLRAAAPHEAAAYRLHPGITDAILQLLAVCPAGDLPPSMVFMMAEIEEFRWYGDADATGPLVCHAALRPGAADHSAGSVTADITLLTAQGRSVARLTGVHMRRVNRGAVERSAERTNVRAVTGAGPAAGAEVLVALRAGDERAAERLRELLAERTAAVLGAAAGELDRQEALRNLGLDSLTAVELKDEVAGALGLQLSAAMFMDNPSIAGLADALLPRLLSQAPATPAVTEYTGPGGMHVTETGDGPQVLLVHGGAVGGPGSWQAQLALAARWRLVIPSRLNYDKSASSPREDFDEDAVLLAELAGDGAHLVGQSYGAVGAMLAALRRPEAVWSLTLIESGSSGVARDRPAVAGFEQRMRALLAAPPPDPQDQFRALFAIIDPAARFPSPLPAGLRRFAGRITTGVRWPWEADIGYERLRACPFPKLVVSGGQRPAFEEISDALAERLGAERTIVPGGHATQNTGSAFNFVLEDFMTRARPR